MDFIIAAQTDVGIIKETNQDSLSVKVLDTAQGRMVFAVLCDGMGGLAKGEVASATVIDAFAGWLEEQLPQLLEGEITEELLCAQWSALLEQENEKIKAYGVSYGINLGTTVVALLLTQTRYFVLNVGDSRAYMLRSELLQITQDQTFVAREVSLGRMTEEQAKTDKRRSVLLQCVGASPSVIPDLFAGEIVPGDVFLLCSDGFRHEIFPEEIYERCRPEAVTDQTAMNENLRDLIERNKQRGERDNISAVLVRTF